ncbi:hypothetical protein M3Y99_01658800 [Aphelenchoides fujianensis]|nr:hypothetical protein M3Y99_01658800 [Aphelenchoides fujianensis]
MKELGALLIVWLIGSFVEQTSAVNCLQCSGWYGDYPPGDEAASTCDNANNACTTAQFCVRIVDPIFKYRGYKTFKADCYTSTQFVSQSSTYTIENGKCYNFTGWGISAEDLQLLLLQ